MKSIDNIINKLKEKSAKAFRNITLLTGISLFSLITGCENKPMISPLGPNIENTAYLPTETKFSGNSFQVEFQPLERPYQKVEARGDKPTQPMSDWIELQDTNQDGKYTLALSSASTPLYGDYNVQPRYTSGDEVTEGSIVTIPVHMNEAQSDSALQQIIAPLVKAGSTTDGDIIAASYNQNVWRNGRQYNDDVYLTIYNSGLNRSYALDVQGSISDTFSSQKKIDADAVGSSYNNIGTFSSTANLETKVMELNDAKWSRTDQ